MKFKKGELSGTLKTTKVEVWWPSKGYVWVSRLVLVSDHGRWLYGDYWHSTKKAQNELESSGWTLVENRTIRSR